MKININKIPPEGLTLEKVINPAELDLDTNIVKFCEPIKIKAEVFRITNAITLDVALNYGVCLNCSRCLDEFKVEHKKKLKLNYSASNSEPIIDLNPDIRDEIILDYPMQPLCRVDCKGLCVKCGRNLNEGKCNC